MPQTDAFEAFEVRRKDRMKAALTQAGSAADITAPRQLPVSEGHPGGWQVLQLWCGHWGKGILRISVGQRRRHEKLSLRPVATSDASCGG